MISIISDKDDPPTEQDHIDGIIASVPEQLTLAEAKLKFCTDCKYLLGVRYRTDAADNWSCVHPNNLIRNDRVWNLVIGIQEYIREYHEGSLKVLREDPKYCGPEGKWWEEYIKPEYKPEPTIAGVHAKEIKEVIENDVFKSTDLQGNREAARQRIEALKAKRKS